MKIYHGPTNIGGIGRYLADQERKAGYVSDFIIYQDFTTRQNSHVNLNIEKYSYINRKIILVIFFVFCLLKYDVFHFYFGATLLPLNFDLPLLKLFRKKVIMTYCGSDIRLIEVEINRNPYSHLLRFGLDDPKYDSIKKRKMHWQNLWVDKFFAVRDNFEHAKVVIPEHKIVKNIFIHNTMDLGQYCPKRYETKAIPKLVHAPSEKGIKGTKYVENAINELKKEGYQFEYLELHKVANDEAQRIYREEADVIIDQFILGSYGNLAIEAMYYGKPVMCYLCDDLIQKEFPDCPIVNANIDNLKEKISWLINNPEERIKIGKAGRLYVEKHCDRKKISHQLLEVYQSL